jgi:hypothetical protein
MSKKNILENSEIFELKNKCKLVQSSIARVVEKIPVGNIKEISLKKDGQQESKGRNIENESRNLQN